MINRPLQHSLALPVTILSTSKHLPPAFLLPFRAHLTTASTVSTTKTTTVTHTLDPRPPPNAYESLSQPLPIPSSPIPPTQTYTSAINPPRTAHPQLSRHTPFKPPLPPTTATGPNTTLLRALAAQKPHYIVAHLHARPYLLTEGDELRLPFLMPDAKPGTVIQLNRASVLGSREFTFRAGGVTAEPAAEDGAETEVRLRKKGEKMWIDSKYFLCRAMVVAIEGEPMRIKLKTKRRQRHVKRVTTKGRFTVLRIMELTVRPDGEARGEGEDA